MDTAAIIVTIALLGAGTGLWLVIDSGRRHRRQTRKAEERRRRESERAKLRARDPADLRRVAGEDEVI